MIGALLGAAGFLSNLAANQQNASNFRESQRFNRQMFTDTNIYNSPMNQVSRLRAAGLNPALMYGKDAGTASAMSAPAANPAVPLDFNALNTLGANLTLNGSQKRLLDEQANSQRQDVIGKNIDNSYKVQNWIADLRNKNLDSDTKENLKQLQELDIKYQTQSLRYRVEQQKYQMQLADAQVVAADITNQYLPAQLSESINATISSAFANYASGRASLKSAMASVMSAVNQGHAFEAQYGGDESQRKAFYQAVLDGMIQSRRTAASTEFQNQFINEKGFSISAAREYDQFLGHREKRPRRVGTYR